MNPESLKFGRGPRELTGGVDLINLYKLRAHHSFFCKKTLPSAVSETHYLHNVVGDVEIRKGEGMELDQLFRSASCLREKAAKIHPFALDTLNQAFQLRETALVELPSAFRGAATISRKTKDASKDGRNKHKKRKDRDGKQDKEHKKHKRNKERHCKGKDNENKDKDDQLDLGGDQTKGHRGKKHKDGHVGDIDNQKHKKIKFKSSQVGQPGRTTIAG